MACRGRSSDDQIAAVLSRFPNPVEAANELVAVANLRGGNDNITVVVIDVLASENSPDTMIVVPHPTVTGPTRAVPAAPKAAVPRKARKAPAPKRVTLRVVVFVVALLYRYRRGDRLPRLVRALGLLRGSLQGPDHHLPGAAWWRPMVPANGRRADPRHGLVGALLPASSP